MHNFTAIIRTNDENYAVIATIINSIAQSSYHRISQDVSNSFFVKIQRVIN